MTRSRRCCAGVAGVLICVCEVIFVPSFSRVISFSSLFVSYLQGTEPEQGGGNMCSH